MSGRTRTIALLSLSLLASGELTHARREVPQEPASGDPVVSAPAQAAAPVVVPPPAPPAEPARVSFDEWLTGVRQEALARGVREATIAAALDGLEPLPVVLERDRSQAELVLSVDQYLDRRLTRALIRAARQMAARHRALLGRVGSEYGVQSRFVVAIWGLESNFGRFSGVRPTIQALATLGWDGRRGAFFKSELLDALEILDKGYIAPEQLRGSWAGAMGQTQFMPSSYLKWAQDFDRDGDRDIWKSEGDIFASIANYLKEHGWASDETWGREVRLPGGGMDSVVTQVGMRESGCRAEREMTNRVPLSRWQTLGVRSLGGGALPTVERDASLVHTGKRTFLVYQNYESLLEYNCAHTYALSVALLADRIGG